MSAEPIKFLLGIQLVVVDKGFQCQTELLGSSLLSSVVDVDHRREAEVKVKSKDPRSTSTFLLARAHTPLCSRQDPWWWRVGVHDWEGSNLSSHRPQTTLVPVQGW